MKTHHITLSSDQRSTLTRDDQEARAAVRALARPSRERLLLFAIVDDHIHFVVRVRRPRVLARDVVRSLQLALPNAEFQSPHVRAVESRAHHEWLVRYLLDQPRKHGLVGHPALSTGSCFQDLVGARLLPGYDLQALASELPRLRLRDVLPLVGLSSDPLGPADDTLLQRAGAARIVDLSIGVHALPASLPLRGQTANVTAVRALAAQACLQVGFRPAAVAPFLGVTDRTVRRLARRPLDPRALPALRRRLSLENRAQAA